MKFAFADTLQVQQLAQIEVAAKKVNFLVKMTLSLANFVTGTACP